MWTADDSIGHHHRLGSGRLDEGPDFLRNGGIVPDIDTLGEPASKVRNVGILGLHNAHGEFGRPGIVRAIERDRCDGIAAEPFLALAQPLPCPLKHVVSNRRHELN
jgi:hypothetical protein